VRAAAPGGGQWGSCAASGAARFADLAGRFAHCHRVAAGSAASCWPLLQPAAATMPGATGCWTARSVRLAAVSRCDGRGGVGGVPEGPCCQPQLQSCFRRGYELSARQGPWQGPPFRVPPFNLPKVFKALPHQEPEPPPARPRARPPPSTTTALSARRLRMCWTTTTTTTAATAPSWCAHCPTGVHC
jgi:hypothetical protein